MSRKRRSQRKMSMNKVVDAISLKKFFIIAIPLIIIISICSSVICYRNYQDRKLLAEQRMELEKSIEDIFVATSQSIEENTMNTPNEVIRISAVGDILCGEEMLSDAYQKDSKSYQFDYMFKNITNFVKESDIVLGTMETSFTDNTYSGYGNRNSPKEFGQAVKDSGINLVSITTNHSLDYGIDGIKKTKSYLQELGFSTVGDRLDEQTVNIQTIKDKKIAFLSYTYGVENQNKKSKKELQSINIYSEKLAKQELDYAKENADFIFVIMHWGEPYATEVSDEQRKIADFLVENGADVILGNHPAAIQPMEVRKNKEGEDVFIAYSLGNYISSISNEVSKVELVLNIEITIDSENEKLTLTKVDYTPIYALDNGLDAQNRYELIDMKGIAKRYASGDIRVVDKNTYNKLLDGLKLLENVVKVEEKEEINTEEKNIDKNTEDKNMEEKNIDKKNTEAIKENKQ